jgi:hypothetical protein
MCPLGDAGIAPCYQAVQKNNMGIKAGVFPKENAGKE